MNSKCIVRNKIVKSKGGVNGLEEIGIVNSVVNNPSSLVCKKESSFQENCTRNLLRAIKGYLICFKCHNSCDSKSWEQVTLILHYLTNLQFLMNCYDLFMLFPILVR